MTDEEKLKFVQQFLKGATINQFNMHDGYQQNNYNDRGSANNEPAADHPLAPYIRRGDKVDIILDWLRRAIMVQSTPKEQLAPIKAAMECHPQAVNRSLTFDVFNQEFGLTVSESSWDNWIKGHHGTKYADSELNDYEEDLSKFMTS